MSVYIDILFFVNLMINTVILLASAMLMKVKYSPARIFLGAVLGAVYSCVMFFPKLRLLYTLGAKVIAAAAISWVSFSPKTLISCIKQTAVFYTVTFIFGVASLGILYFTDIGIRLGGVISNGVFYFNIPLSFLVFSCGATYLGISLGARFLRKSSERCFADIVIIMDGKKAELRALVDTGNMLKDPFSGKSVMIAEAKSLEPLFDFDICSLALNLSAESVLPLGFRLIPFSSIGKKDGILVAFVPEKIMVNNTEKTNIVAALHTGQLSKDREYNALLSPDGLERNFI